VTSTHCPDRPATLHNETGGAYVPITSDWGMELEEGYQRQVQDGDLVLWKPGRTVYAAVYSTDNAEAEEAIEKMLHDRPASPLRTFDRAEGSIAGHAYLLPEGEGGDEYWGLNTWTAAKGSVACVTFYFDAIEDLEWALAAWRTVRCGVCSVN
jgi:hypothetical protein